MKHVALWLMIFMAMAGMPAEASVMPGCLMMMPADAPQHSCCPQGACDCKIEIPRTQDLASPEVPIEFRLYSQGLQIVQDFSMEPKTIASISDEAQESPPKDNPLYEKYSNYRI